MTDSEIAALVVAVLMLGISWRSSRASRAAADESATGSVFLCNRA
jgi:hypothetical protein